MVVVGTYDPERLAVAARSSLLAASGYYRRRPDGDLQYDGERPGGRWHAHGYFPRWLWMLHDGRLIRRRLWKRRWRAADEGETRHSRPLEDTPSLRSCVLIVVLKLWSLVDAGRGVHTSPDVLPDLEGHVHARTVQRWFHRVVPHALALQQAIRRAVIERCEPRPVEHLFPSGLDPPGGLLRRHWRDPSAVATLWRALAILFGGAIKLDVPASLLLAEARGRYGTPGRPLI